MCFIEVKAGVRRIVIVEKDRPSRHQATSALSHGGYEVIIRAQLDWHMKNDGGLCLYSALLRSLRLT